MKKKQTMLVANNKYLKSVIVKQREELEALKEDSGRLQLGKEQLEQGIVACRRAMQELSNNITILSNDNDVQASELKEFVQKEKLDEASQAWQRQSYLNTKKSMLNTLSNQISRLSNERTNYTNDVSYYTDGQSILTNY